jgi:RNA polymerase sigma factor (TIGR02999 family)
MDTFAPARGEVTLVLHRLQNGDFQALADLAPLVGAELRRLAARSLRNLPPGQTWQPTDLVHELWLRFLGRSELHFQNRPHFLAVASHIMRGMVIDHVRRRCARKRTPEAPPETANEFEMLLGLTDSRAVELVSLDDAITRLAAMRPRQAEIVEMRYFGGCTVEETAEVLGISAKTVKREWAAARAWLHAELNGISL